MLSIVIFKSNSFSRILFPAASITKASGILSFKLPSPSTFVNKRSNSISVSVWFKFCIIFVQLLTLSPTITSMFELSILLFIYFIKDYL